MYFVGFSFATIFAIYGYYMGILTMQGIFYEIFTP